MALSKEDILLGLPIEDVVQRAENNFVQVFNELEDEVGYTIGLSVDPSSYEMTLELKNSVGDTISTASVDLPIESLVLSASYAKGILTLQLQSGQTLDVDISSLISGLVPDSRTINGKNLKSNVTLTQDDVGDGTSYVRFTPAEKEKLKNIATGANNYQPPTYTGLPTTKGLYKIKVNSNGDVVEATAVAKSDITALGIAGNENATPSKAGLMSATDKAKLNGIAEGANKYVLPNAGATLGGVKSGGDVTIQDGVITVTTVGGKTADEIGKVKDVTVNGASVLNESTGVAEITIESLKSGYVNVNVSDSSWADCTVNGTKYKAIKVADTDTELEVYNSDGNKILTHTVRKEKEGYLYICVGTTAINCTLRKINGNSIGTGGTSSGGGSTGGEDFWLHTNIDDTITVTEPGLYAVFFGRTMVEQDDGNFTNEEYVDIISISYLGEDCRSMLGTNISGTELSTSKYVKYNRSTKKLSIQAPNTQPPYKLNSAVRLKSFTY